MHRNEAILPSLKKSNGFPLENIIPVVDKQGEFQFFTTTMYIINLDLMSIGHIRAYVSEASDGHPSLNVSKVNFQGKQTIFHMVLQ